MHIVALRKVSEFNDGIVVTCYRVWLHGVVLVKETFLCVADAVQLGARPVPQDAG